MYQCCVRYVDTTKRFFKSTYQGCKTGVLLAPWGLLFSLKSRKEEVEKIGFHFVVIMVSISILIGCDCFANIKLTKLCYQLLVTCHTGVRHEILSPGSAAQRDSARPRAFQNSVTSLVSASVTEKKSGARRRRWRT